MNKSELESRLVRFSDSVIRLTNGMKQDYASRHLAKQIIRSATSTALNYGEAQGAVTHKDFINKVSIVLKELRETSINLKIIESTDLVKDKIFITGIIDENGQLIAIFTKTLQTAKRNQRDGKY